MVMGNIVSEVVRKKEIAELPVSLVKKVVELGKIKTLDDKSKVKEARALLRKYFSVFMSNKLMKGKIGEEEILKKHISTKQRDYQKLYKRILKDEKTIIDFGAGLNGFSYKYINKFSNAKYIAVEAIKRFVDLMNNYFSKHNFNAAAYWGDLFDIEKISKIVRNTEEKRIVFMFNIIDALEVIERDYSKKLICCLAEEIDKFVLSFPTKSLSGKKKFNVNRKWILDFLEKNFEILDDFETNGERFIVFRKN